MKLTTSFYFWSGRTLLYVTPNIHLFKRMEIEVEAWLATVKQFDNWFHRAAGRVETLIHAAQKQGK